MLTTGKKIEQGGSGGLLNLGIVAGIACFAGGLAMVTANGVRPARPGQGGDDAAKAADAATTRVVGLFLETKTGGAGNRDIRVDVLGSEGFLLKNSGGGDAITEAHVGRYCFVVDDETVALTSANGTRPPAGVVREVGADGVVVEVSPAIAAAAALALA
jgi:hypothetical protein